METNFQVANMNNNEEDDEYSLKCTLCPGPANAFSCWAALQIILMMMIEDEEVEKDIALMVTRMLW